RRGRRRDAGGGHRGVPHHSVGPEGEGHFGEHLRRHRQVRPDRRGAGEGRPRGRLQGAGGGAPGGDQRGEGAADPRRSARRIADDPAGEGCDGRGAEGGGGGEVTIV